MSTPRSQQPDERHELASYARRVVVTVAIVILIGGAVALIGAMLRMVLLILLAVVFAVFIQGAARRLARRLSWPRWVCVAAIVSAFALVVAGTAALLGPSVAGQAEELARRVPESFAALRDKLESTGLGARLLSTAPEPGSLLESNMFDLSGMSRWLGGAIDAFSAVAFLLVMIAFLTVEPALYRDGLIRLVPPAHRDMAERTADEIEARLFEWTIARFTAMAAVSVLTGAGLWLAGVPMPLALGLLAGVFSFVPFVGPIVAAVPGLLIALVQGPMIALAALGVYVGVQALEGNVITPLLQSKMASLPPVLMIVSQFVLGASAGISGLITAGPVALLLMTLVECVYIEGILEAGDDDDAGD